MTDPLCSLRAAHEFAGQAPEVGGQLLELALDRARNQESGRRPIHAFLSLAEPPPDAWRAASRSPAGSPLAGIPVAVKDNICTWTADHVRLPDSGGLCVALRGDGCAAA